MTHSSHGAIKASRVHEYGAPLVLEELQLREPGNDEVFVELVYAGVNPLDTYVSSGKVASEFPLPRTIGSEASGYLNGKPVLVFGEGLGRSRDGVFASGVIAPRTSVFELPPSIDMTEAACLGIAGVTAWNVVVNIAEITPNDRVFVMGAGGGCGLAIVSLAASLGATVWGQVGTAGKVPAVTDHGAENVIVDDASDLADLLIGLQPTVIIDPLGGPFTAAALEALEPNGRHVVYGTTAGPDVSFNLQNLYRKTQRILGYGGMMLTYEERAHSAREAAMALMDGRMRLEVDRIMPVADVNTAFSLLMSRKITGKLVLDLR